MLLAMESDSTMMNDDNGRDPNSMQQRTSRVEDCKQASFQHDSSWLLAGCSGAVSIGARPALAAAVMHSRRRACKPASLQACNVVWITGRGQRVVVR
jgi:hypothetical protein